MRRGGLGSGEAEALVRRYCTRWGVLPTKRQAAERTASWVISVSTALCLAALLSGPILVDALLRRHSPRSEVMRVLQLHNAASIGAVLVYVLVVVVCLTWLQTYLRTAEHGGNTESPAA